MELKKRVLAFVLCLSVLNHGCATTRDSLLLGAGLGAGAGGSVGYATNHENAAGTLIGVATGAVIGGAIGYFINKTNGGDKSESKLTSASVNPNAPTLTNPRIRSLYEPDKIEGDRYIKGHEIFVIDKPATWSKD